MFYKRTRKVISNRVKKFRKSRDKVFYRVIVWLNEQFKMAQDEVQNKDQAVKLCKRFSNKFKGLDEISVHKMCNNCFPKELDQWYWVKKNNKPRHYLTKSLKTFTQRTRKKRRIS